MKNEKRKLNIKTLFLDVDGVLTDGSIIYDSDGKEIKVFNVQDGLGIELAQKAGIKIFIVTTRRSKCVEKRARELRVYGVYQGVRNKKEAVIKIIGEMGINKKEAAFMGDDLVDVPAMKEVGMPLAPANARPEVKKIVKHVTKKEGGKGAVREAIEYILKCEKKWRGVTANYGA